MYGILDIPNIDSDTGGDELLLCSFVAPTRVTSNVTVRGSDTMSLKRIRTRSVAQRWEIETDSAIMDGSADLWAHQAENDMTSSIYVRPPLPVKSYTVTKGYARDGAGTTVEYPLAQKGFANSDGTGEATAGAGVTNNSLVIKLDLSSQLFKSDFIRFDGHDKVYMVTAIDSVSVVSDNAVVRIFPALVANVSALENVYLGKKATMKMVYDLGSVLGISYVDGILADPGRLSLVEDL